MSSLNHLRNAEQYSRLAEIIKSESHSGEVDFCPSPGNWGDALINLGSRQFFSEHDIVFREFRRHELPRAIGRHSDRVLVVGGGGGWCIPWNSTGPFTAEMAKVYRSVIVLPSTFEPAQTEIISAYDNIILISRDHLIPSGHRLNTWCHDMALYINLSSDFSPLIIEPNLYRLHAFRTDKESTGLAQSFPPPNHDVSLLGNSYNNPSAFFTVISHYRLIVTDRLHVAITANLLGRPCLLYPSNYRKIPDVHSASFARNYPECQLMADENQN